MLELTQEQKKTLESAGVQLNYSKLVKAEYTLREVARICDYAEAWVRTQVKTGKIKATKNTRGHWRVKRAEVARVRQEQATKLLNRIELKLSGKKEYDYKRPTEWAYHLTMKAIRSDQKLQPAQKKQAIGMMNRYKDAWEKAYAARVAKREANALLKAK